MEWAVARLKKGKRVFGVSKRGKSNVVVIIMINAVLPFLAFLLASVMDGWKMWVIFPIFFVILILNYILIIRPIMQMEYILTQLGKNEETPSEMNELKYGFGVGKIFFQMYEEQKKYMEREYLSEMLRQEAELMALQSQMNPHFLYNTLDSIRGYAVLHNVKEIADMTEALAKLSRRMTASSSKMVTLGEEIRLAENYMTIQRFRFNNRFTLKTIIRDQTVLDCKVLNLLLQPIVENAVAHGFQSKSGNFEVSVDAYITEKRMIIQIKDDGCGIASEKLLEINQKLNGKNIIDQVKESNQHIGIALPNINQRIKLYFGNEYGINIMSTEGIGTNVEVVLPLIMQEGEADEA